ncbi:Transcription initiation factor TFIID subunit 9 [Monascus purpureus]|uniref:Transcription initiation factor TFIID subunit 9 n=1 Tax=Monascus purpureus TaxID=5098 RepID=A0A507QN71_MONPU|nr:Transcription initiation factor TFIID subunit 9 [Monascus purpureus]BDD57331.1 hypothetical protein MAP00_002700 [Monascus purpureus]
MASPTQMQTSASATQPLTPPAEPSTNNVASQPNANNPTTLPQPPQVPATSLRDSGKSRRPRDVRLIHLLLASLGVTAYEERVPLQLLDFAYRYTSGVLQDAVHLYTEGYAGATGIDAAHSVGSGRGPLEVNSVTLPALRLSIASRLHYQFQTGLPKEFLMDVAAERNRVALPGAMRGYDSAASAARTPQSTVMAGMRLPPERFCLTGLGWNLKEGWESEGEEEVTEETQVTAAADNGDAGIEEEDDEDGRMEDIFGEDTVMGEGGEDGGDKDMTDI